MLQLPQANGNHRANGARVSQRTVYDCKKIISRAFKYATDELELITENPMLGVTVKQPKSGRREVWTEEQFNFAYDNCSDPQLKLLISLMIALSSRIGECLALTWSDVYDNEDKHEPSYIRVYKQLVYRSEEFVKETNGRGNLKVFDQVRGTRPDAKRRAVFHVTKTEKGIEAKTDRIYVAPEVIFMLRDYKLVQNQHKQLAGDSYKDDDLIFAHEDGTHISSQYADDMFSSSPKVILLTDGYATDIGLFKSINSVLKTYVKNRISISTVGLGDVDTNLMNKIAKTTGGVFIDVSDASDLGDAMTSAATQYTSRDLLSTRYTTNLNFLYALLRIIFISILGIAIGFAAAIAYGSQESSTLIFVSSAIKSIVGAILMEIGTDVIGISDKLVWFVLWILISVTIATKQTIYKRDPRTPSRNRSSRRLT